MICCFTEPGPVSLKHQTCIIHNIKQQSETSSDDSAILHSKEKPNDDSSKKVECIYISKSIYLQTTISLYFLLRFFQNKKERRQWIRCVVWCIKRQNHDEPIFIFLHGVTFGSFEARCFSTTRRKDPRRVNRIVIQWDEWKHHQWHSSYCSKLPLQHGPIQSE